MLRTEGESQMRHGFDNKLNSTTSGFGVAWVEDAN